MITNAIDPERALLRHTIATLAYRGGKAIRGAPESFSSFKIGDPPKTPGQILAHIGDLLGLGACYAVRRQTGVEQYGAAELDRRQRAIPRNARTSRRAHRIWRAAQRISRRSFSRPDRRRAHACWPDQHAAPPRGRSDQRRELPPRRNHRWQRRRGANRTAEGNL